MNGERTEQFGIVDRNNERKMKQAGTHKRLHKKPTKNDQKPAEYVHTTVTMSTMNICTLYSVHCILERSNAFKYWSLCLHVSVFIHMCNELFKWADCCWCSVPIYSLLLGLRSTLLCHRTSYLYYYLFVVVFFLNLCDQESEWVKEWVSVREKQRVLKRNKSTV